MFLYSVYNLYKTRVMNIIYFNNIALHKTLINETTCNISFNSKYHWNKK